MKKFFLGLFLLFTTFSYAANIHNTNSIKNNIQNNASTNSNSNSSSRSNSSSSNSLDFNAGTTILPAIPQPPDHSKEHISPPFEFNAQKNERANRDQILDSELNRRNDITDIKTAMLYQEYMKRRNEMEKFKPKVVRPPLSDRAFEEAHRAKMRQLSEEHTKLIYKLQEEALQNRIAHDSQYLRGHKYGLKIN